jgi:hypothetical protein
MANEAGPVHRHRPNSHLVSLTVSSLSSQQVSGHGIMAV